MEKIIDNDLTIANENEKLIANILHDIKSPLYSIKIGLASQLNTELNKDIYETTISIIEYIENFLIEYNFKHGKFNCKIMPCDIKSLICKKLEFYKYIFKDRKIFTDLYCSENDCNINTIPIFASSIIGNLISNMAFHSAPNKHVSVGIYRKQECINVDFKNKYNQENHKFTLGLEFCQNLANLCKMEMKYSKTKTEFRVSLKIPNLNY